MRVDRWGMRMDRREMSMDRLGMTMILVLAGLAAACTERTAGAAPPPAAKKESTMTEQAAGGQRPARQLPDSFGRTFASLDEYLAHLRRYAGPIDKPWYREIRPGVYERVTTLVPRRETQIYTRAQLMERFGFTR